MNFKPFARFGALLACVVIGTAALGTLANSAPTTPADPPASFVPPALKADFGPVPIACATLGAGLLAIAMVGAFRRRVAFLRTRASRSSKAPAPPAWSRYLVQTGAMLVLLGLCLCFEMASPWPVLIGAFTPQTTIAAGMTPQFQLWIDSMLLKHVVQRTVFDEYAMNGTLPGGAGATTARYLKQGAADATQVQTLTEGVPVNVSRALTLTPVNVPLVEYGEVIAISDILLATQLIDTMKLATVTLGEDCALKMDTLIRDELAVNIVAAGNARYAQATANFAGLSAASVSAGSATISDFLDCFTRLEITRAPRVDGGDYIAMIPPEVRRDLLKDSVFTGPAQYADAKRIFKGEIGEYYGVRFVVHTNPFREANSVQNTYNAAGPIYSSFVTGMQAYGFVKLASMNPNIKKGIGPTTASTVNPANPKLMIARGPDKSDPLAQLATIGWKSFNAPKLLDGNWICNLRSKTQYT